MVIRKRPGPAATGHTPHRTIRVSDDLWRQVAATAEARGETITAVVVRALESYVRRHRKQETRRPGPE